jgi:uncharacterized protein (DUF924 family)
MTTTLTDYDENKIIHSICSYWFGDSIQSTTLTNQQKSVLYQELWDSTWFGGLYSKQVDDYIRTTYGEHLDNANNGMYQKLESSAMGCLALVILFDQFSRNIYRNSPQSFAYDEKARSITFKCIENGLDKELVPIARAFLYLPLLHSENLDHQSKSVQLFHTLYMEQDAKIPVLFKRFSSLADGKYKEIEKYGRFPKRNKILGRKTTYEENQEYPIEW